MVSNRHELCRTANGPAGREGSPGRGCWPDAPAHTIYALIKRTERENMVNSPSTHLRISLLMSIAGPRYWTS